MSILVILIPVSLGLGLVGLLACIWTMRSGQYEDMEGDAARILIDRPDPGPDSRTDAGADRDGPGA